MTSTLSPHHDHHEPLEVATLTTQEFETRLSDLDDAITTRQTNIGLEQTRATLAEIAEVTRATAAEEALLTAITGEAESRLAALNLERLGRVATDSTEASQRATADIALQRNIDALATVASTSGGTATTSLTRNAGAAVIASIGGDGTTTTVDTDGTHGYVDGDYVTIAGTTNYNGDTGPIDVVSTTQFTYASAVNAATETTGTAATKRIRVVSITPFVANQQITITSDAGQLHTTTVSGTPSGDTIVLAAPVPTLWTLTARASAGAIVSSTIEEIRLARMALGEPALALPALLELLAQNTHNVMRRAAGDGVTDDTAAIQATIDAAAASTRNRTVYFPPGDYVIASKTGGVDYHREDTSILINQDHLSIVFAQGARLLIKDGAHARPFLVRKCNDIVLHNVVVVDQRTVRPGGGAGIAIEDCSHVRHMHCTVDGGIDYGLFYGFSVTEDSSTYKFPAASTVSYNAASHEIRDSANGFGSIQTDDVIYVYGAANTANNGYKTVTNATAGVLTVAETLVDEAAGSSPVQFVSSDISVIGGVAGGFNDPNGAFLNFRPAGITIRTAGFTNPANNGDWTVVAVSDDGVEISVEETTLVDEAAGASVTVSKVGVTVIEVFTGLPCDDISYEFCTAIGVGVFGWEIFPKPKSRNLRIVDCFAFDCGFAASAGYAMKVSQSYIGAICARNLIAHCQFGMSVGNYDSANVIDNILLNTTKADMTLNVSNHPRNFTEPTQDTLVVAGNVCANVTDLITRSGAFVQPQIWWSIYVVGIKTCHGLIDVSNNMIANKTGGIGMAATQQHSNVHYTRNRVIDSGLSQVLPRHYTGTFTNGSPTISAMTNYGTATTGTVGWHVGMEVVGIAIPATTPPPHIIAIDAVAQTMTMSANATADLVAAEFWSGAPVDLDWAGNTFVNTHTDDTDRNNFVRISGDRAVVKGDSYRGYGEYALYLQGDSVVAEDIDIIEPNPKPTHASDRGGVFLYPDFQYNGGAATGLYKLRRVNIHLGRFQAEGAARIQYIVNNTAVATLYINDCAPGHPDIRPVRTPSTTAVLAAVVAHGGNRVLWGTAPPTTGIHYAGDIVHNTAPTTARNIAFWVCVTSGTPGTFRAVGTGSGTTAQRPADLGAQDAEYRFRNTTTGNTDVWNGSAYAANGNLSKVRYTTAAGQVLANGTTTIINFGTVDYDPSSLVTTGAAWAFTVPETGTYRVTAQITFVATDQWALGTKDGRLLLAINGVALSFLDWNDSRPAGTNQIMILRGTDTVNVTAGQIIQVFGRQGTGGTLALLADAQRNYISIHKT